MWRWLFRRRSLIWSGAVAMFTGALLACDQFTNEHPHPSLGLTLVILGFMAIGLGTLLTVTRPLGEIYKAGYEDGRADQSRVIPFRKPAPSAKINRSH